MTSWTKAAIGCFIIQVVLLGCGGGGSPGANTSPTATPAPQVQVVETGTNSAATEPDELPFNNCAANVAFTGKHSVSRELTYTTTWEFGIGGEVSVTPALKVNVDANVSAKYNKQVGQTSTFSDEFDINVPPKSRMTYVFNWKEMQRLGYLLAGGNKINYKFPIALQFAGAQASQDVCDPPPQAAAAPVPSPTPAPVPGITAALPIKPLPVVESKTPTPAALPAPVAAEKFVKNWTNVDPKTDGITHIEISQAAGMLNLQTYGKCTPVDCNWGAVKVAYAGGGSLNVPYKFSFKTTTLSLTLLGSQLVATEADHYTDSSGRPDRKATYQFM
jgi:hypothetical protein